MRGNHIPLSGMITPSIIEHLLFDELVIADLTYDDANVFYELALRHRFKKPAILIKEENERIPFDIRDMRIIPVDSKFIDSMEKCKNEIINQIKEW